ncbi:N-acetyltransferase [Methylovirgula sp. 4M-Z18]|nr:N-acetyltransferase [Methylovirgula sp. 4M-Z18]
MFDVRALRAAPHLLPPQTNARIADPIRVRDETARDVAARERLLDAAMGPQRFEKSSERLREGRLAAQGLSVVATHGDTLVGTVRLWHVDAGGVPALLLGPLAVDSAHRAHGIGGRLMDAAIARAKADGHKAILLVGDAPYYQRFGFDAALTGKLDMPGPTDRARFLALELEQGVLAGAKGKVRPTGALHMRRRPSARKARRAA